MLVKIQPDTIVCRYLFTAKSLYMFRVSQHPSSEVLKMLTAASGSGLKKTLLTIKISIILRGLMQINAALKVFVTHIVRDGRSENFIIDTIRKFVFHTALRRPLASTQLIFSSRNLKLFPNR